MNKIAKMILVVATLVLLSGYLVKKGYFKGDADKAPAAIVIDSAELREANIFNKHAVDTAVSLLRSGNIVMRMGLGADSKLLSELNARNKTFSHCGIVMMEQGYPYVYHSIGGEDNPDERLRRDSASLFFSPKYNSDIGIIHFSFDTGDVNALKQVVAGYYKERPKFDMKFDLGTDDKLYCSEFVYKAINKAMKDTAYIQATTLVGHRFVGIDDIFMNEHANIIWQIKFK